MGLFYSIYRVTAAVIISTSSEYRGSDIFGKNSLKKRRRIGFVIIHILLCSLFDVLGKEGQIWYARPRFFYRRVLLLSAVVRK
jgi:hypothetical protein